jgi:NADPH:quinone reductase
MQERKSRAITLTAYQGNIIRAVKGLKINTITFPLPSSDEVLIEVDAAPCNPSDLAFIQGGYNVRKSLPAIPGFEGCGMVMETGSDQAAIRLKGKRVSFFSQSDGGGSWAGHIIIRACDCLEVSSEMPVEQAACFAVNPFTALAMVMHAAAKGANAIIQNAAAGQVGRFVNALCRMEGISVINIVRKEEQAVMPDNAGSSYVLWQSDAEFQSRLHALARELNASIAFDAVGGEGSGRLLAAMPPGGTLYVYGALGSRQLADIPAADIIFEKKSVRGFNMNEWKENLDGKSFREISEKLQQLFISGKLKTLVQGTFLLEEYEEALFRYIRNMSAGKILLCPKK